MCGYKLVPCMIGDIDRDSWCELDGVRQNEVGVWLYLTCPATLGHGVFTTDGLRYDDGIGAASAHNDFLLVTSDGVSYSMPDGAGAASAHSDSSVGVS